MFTYIDKKNSGSFLLKVLFLVSVLPNIIILSLVSISGEFELGKHDFLALVYLLIGIFAGGIGFYIYFKELAIELEEKDFISDAFLVAGISLIAIVIPSLLFMPMMIATENYLHIVFVYIVMYVINFLYTS